MTPAEFNRIGRALYGAHFKAELAEALGLTHRTLRYYVTGERGIPDDMREKLARIASKRVAEITRAVAA